MLDLSHDSGAATAEGGERTATTAVEAASMTAAASTATRKATNGGGAVMETSAVATVKMGAAVGKPEVTHGASMPPSVAAGPRRLCRVQPCPRRLNPRWRCLHKIELSRV
ncbi:hypothetical protein GUJ93_ZPchr0002g25421 [Zizania palustris]|uniref:Uncharacterized protein n=1 Tax=Zizania palustris TaxID=103762 RepID=A0A8J5S814_ZIZPA|nr:hypothetical protein GUJ93_ZPchr0002g25421 [Zizania palustris]